MTAEAADWPGYRRSRTHVCGELRIDGETVTVDQVRQWRHQRRGDTVIAPELRGRSLACLQRPHDILAVAWVDDVCTSSWGRTCPYLRAGERAGAA